MDETVTMAHSELRALVTKAARGAGMAWGLAEEAGWAADWLARRGMPAAEWATHWLAGVLGGQADPVTFGSGFADRMACGDGPFQTAALPDDLGSPGFVLPFLHLVAKRHGPIWVGSLAGQAALVGADGSVVFGPAWSDRTAGWSICLAQSGGVPGRRAVAVSVVDCLEGLAMQTTVPPSDQSRRDAGSVGNDND